MITSPERRPSGLLATEVTRQVHDALDLLARQRPRVRFAGLRLEAAGSDTPLMLRVAEEVAALAGVPVDPTATCWCGCAGHVGERPDGNC